MFQSLFKPLTDSRVFTWFSQNKGRAMTASLLLGFIWDSLTLGSPDRVFDNVVLLFYLTVSASAITLLVYRKHKGKKESLLTLNIIQFSFGNLAGALLVLYGKSGTISGSALFFTVFAIFILGNEFLKNFYSRIHFQISNWFFLLFMYLVLVMPVLFNKIGTLVFLISGLSGIAIAIAFVSILYFLYPKGFGEKNRSVLGSIFGVFFLFNILYFANLIPPVPLSLKEIGVYHFLSRSGNSYIASYEKPRFYEWPFKNTSGIYHTEGSSATCFSSIFAPSELKAPIYHSWQFYDEGSSRWIRKAEISFTLLGGREEGYRGFSQTFRLKEGRWRCDVLTERGSLIGRFSFEVRKRNPELIETKL